MVNEGELLEKFGIQVRPITNYELSVRAKQLIADDPERVKKASDMICGITRPRMKEEFQNPVQGISEEQIQMCGAYHEAMLDLGKQYHCNCAAMQCWQPFQGTMGIASCGINGFLADADMPVACETDIHGMIGTRMLRAASLYSSSVLFADLTIRHRYNENAELLWHCGNFPPSMAGDGEKTIWESGRTHFELKKGLPVTVVRFDGDHGKYQLLVVEGKGVDGPVTGGTYLWFEVKDWIAWEDKIVKGPYVHHVSGVYGSYVPIMAEACRYIGIEPDFADEGTDRLCREFWYGR